MKIRHAGEREEKTELMMTPMIDIVFQLLVFFIMTFKIVEIEGDFNINMPSDPSDNVNIEQQDSLLMIVRMTEDGNGNLQNIFFGDRSLGRSFEKLRQEARAMVPDHGGPDEENEPEVELDCDYNLYYEYVIEAITAVSGYREQGKIQKIVEKVKFSRPRPEPK